MVCSEGVYQLCLGMLGVPLITVPDSVVSFIIRLYLILVIGIQTFDAIRAKL
jgi:hypothetical protein